MTVQLTTLSLLGLRVCYAVRAWENTATRGYLAMLMYLGRHRGLRAALPCCSATATGSLSLLYIASDSSLVKQDVPNMQVLECGCAWCRICTTGLVVSLALSDVGGGVWGKIKLAVVAEHWEGLRRASTPDPCMHCLAKSGADVNFPRV